MDEGRVEDIAPETWKYLAEKEVEIGRTFTDAQRCWYARRKKTLGLFIFREFPTTIDECFRAPIEGAIYADLIDGLRGKGAVRPSEVDGSALVHTFWDLGSPVNTVVWYAQFVGPEIRILDCDRELDLTATERVAHMLAKGYAYGCHFLPHDAASTNTSGRTIAQQLAAIGLANVRIVPRTTDVWIGINELRQILPRMTFRLPQCEAGIEALTNYHTTRQTASGLAKDEPVHDWSSHPADALRLLAEAGMAGMIPGGSATARAGRRRGGSGVIGGIRDTHPTRNGPGARGWR